MIVRRNGRFGVLWSSQLLSNIGDWLMIVAVPVYVFGLTGSPLATGIAVLAETVPGLLLAPFAGVLVDRRNHFSIMVCSDLLRTAIVLGMLAVHGAGTVWLLYVAIFAQNSVAQFFAPAHQATIPRLVGRGPELESANTWYAISAGVVRLVGGPVGGALYALWGFRSLVLIDAATYLISALMLGLLRLRDSPATGVAPVQEEPRHVLGDLRAGIAFLAGHRVLRGLFGVSALFLMANGSLNVLLVPYAISRLHTDSAGIGLLFSALGLGYLLSAYAGRAISRSGRLRPGIVACMVAAAACFAGLFDLPHYPAALISIGLLGLPGGALLMVVQVQVQRQTPHHLMGRVSSAFSAGQRATTVLGTALGGWLGNSVGVRPTANATIVLVAASAVAALIWLPARVVVPEEVPAAVEPARASQEHS